jgi:hypothetical protein
MRGVAGYERIEVPYPGGHLPGFRVQAKGKERSTFVFNGGYDSFVEEFYAFLLPLTELGFTVIGFDGPGQGGALRQGWARRAEAICRFEQRHSSRGSSTSSRCRRRTGALT